MLPIFFFLFAFSLNAQKFDVLAGPVYGHYTDSTKHFWMLVDRNNQGNNVDNWSVQFNIFLEDYFLSNQKAFVKKILNCSFVDNGKIMVNGILKVPVHNSNFKDISFLLGSCAFPYPFVFWSGKKKEGIFKTMSKHDKDFMLWMGDNVYYLGKEWESAQKMHKKNIKMRLKPHLNAFLKSCPQYAVWDDHDFGENNDNGSNDFKFESLKIFKQYWANPYYGTDSTPGVFTHFSHSDADFFLLDSRYHANDSSMLGQSQSKWLKDKLKASDANFKFIVSGTQILADNPGGEDLGDFGTAKNELLNFIEKEKISGIIFLSGDRHYGELLKMERKNAYPLYELTSSPLTSIINPGYTKNNQIRLPNTLVLNHNFSKIILNGENEKRKCRMEMFNRDGKLLWYHEVLLSDLN